MQVALSNKKPCCQRCGSVMFNRVRRERWMRLLPTSRLLHCNVCGSELFVLIFSEREAACG